MFFWMSASSCCHSFSDFTCCFLWCCSQLGLPDNFHLRPPPWCWLICEQLPVNLKLGVLSLSGGSHQDLGTHYPNTDMVFQPLDHAPQWTQCCPLPGVSLNLGSCLLSCISTFMDLVPLYHCWLFYFFIVPTHAAGGIKYSKTLSEVLHITICLFSLHWW